MIKNIISISHLWVASFQGCQNRLRPVETGFYRSWIFWNSDGPKTGPWLWSWSVLIISGLDWSWSGLGLFAVLQLNLQTLLSTTSRNNVSNGSKAGHRCRSIWVTFGFTCGNTCRDPCWKSAHDSIKRPYQRSSLLLLQRIFGTSSFTSLIH